MRIQDLIDELIAQAGGRLEQTVDTVKAGDSSRMASHVGTCFMATAEVVRKAQALGVDFLITHESTYYNHTDEDRPGHPVVAAKRRLVEESGLTIWRYHDYIHRCQPDGIVEGVLEALGWSGRAQGGAWLLDEPRTARQMAQDIKQRLGAEAVRATGDLDTPFSLVGMAVGDPGFNASMMDKILMQGISGRLLFRGSERMGRTGADPRCGGAGDTYGGAYLRAPDQRGDGHAPTGATDCSAPSSTAR